MRKFTQGKSTLTAIVLLVASIAACAGAPTIGATSWKEEVLLHDGSKLFATRSQTHGGKGEVGQSAPVKEHTISFTLPQSGNSYKWTSEYGDDIGRTNFNLLALHVLAGVPYLVAVPNLCLSYNKWGRPNPPYVFFKADGKSWRQIPLSEVPTEFKTINLIVNNSREEEIKQAERRLGYVSAENVKKINSSLSQSEYQEILRTAQTKKMGITSCEELLPDGHGGWLAIGWFRHSTHEKCTQFCAGRDIPAEFCKCFISDTER